MRQIDRESQQEVTCIVYNRLTTDVKYHRSFSQFHRYMLALLLLLYAQVIIINWKNFVYNTPKIVHFLIHLLLSTSSFMCLRTRFGRYANLFQVNKKVIVYFLNGVLLATVFLMCVDVYLQKRIVRHIKKLADSKSPIKKRQYQLCFMEPRLGCPQKRCKLSSKF